MSASGSSRYLEVERKFDVDASTQPPSFDGLAGRPGGARRDPDSWTPCTSTPPTRDLASNRITLRRRTGGLDAGWHLKLPAGADARTEVRAPLGSDASHHGVQPNCWTWCWPSSAIVRWPGGADQHHPQVQLLHGADDAVIAEFCDDQVTAGQGADGSTARAAVARVGTRTRRRRRERRADGPACATACSMPARNRPGQAPSWRGCSTRRRRSPPADPLHRGAGRADRRAAGVGPRGARRGRRLGPPDAGDRPQDPQPAAGVAGFLRARRRRADHRRTARAGQRARRRPRRRGAGRALPHARWTMCRRNWSAGRSGSDWSAAPSSATGPGSDMRWPPCVYRGISGCSTSWTRWSPKPPSTDRRARTGDRRRPPARKSARRRRRATCPRRRPIATMRSTEFASAPSVFATPRMPPARKRYPSGPRSCSRCSAIIRTAWSAANI